MTVSESNPLVTFMHKSFDGYDLYMLMNTGEEKTGFDAFIPCEKDEHFCLVNIETLETLDITADIKDGKAKISTKLDALSPVIICKY